MEKKIYNTSNLKTLPSSFETIRTQINPKALFTKNHRKFRFKSTPIKIDNLH